MHAVHTVRRGETLIEIAKRFGVQLMELARRNGLSTRSRVLVGQRLVIPREG
jgi:LysM repeat protein